MTLSVNGLDAHPVRVEVDSGRGPTCFHLVGLPEASVRESRVRVRAALSLAGIDLDEYVLTINLAPADLRKSGGGYDLAIAVAAMGALEHVPVEAMAGIAFIGELSLSGAVRAVRGVLPALLGARARGLTRAIVPRDNGSEAAAIEGMEIRVADTLAQVLEALRGKADLEMASERCPAKGGPTGGDVDFSDVRGQVGAKRALEIAAAGGHNVLMIGPPGSGKTMLARRLPTIMPDLSREEALETTAVHSVAGLLEGGVGLLRSRPFRAPHHTVSAVGLVGGGSPIRPGEVSLAHHGCLFLDELLEFRRGALEALRQPLEDGTVTICRAKTRAILPAKPLVVAAVNPCPCGYATDPRRRCGCSNEIIRKYRAKLSGPLLDRLDVHFLLPPVDVLDLQSNTELPESSSEVRARVEAARSIQIERHRRAVVSAFCNARVSPREVGRIAVLDPVSRELLAHAVERLGMSARGYGKVLRVARTIADLEGTASVQIHHVAEAIHLRVFDRDLAAQPSARVSAATPC